MDSVNALQGLQGATVIDLSHILLSCIKEQGERMSVDAIRAADANVTATLVLLRRIANSNAFIDRLHAELLMRIFEYVPMPYHADDPNVKIDDHLRIWKLGIVRLREIMTLTQVCHRWREVAISHPRLWDSIASTYSPAQQRMLLERSRGSMSLKIYLEPGQSYLLDASLGTLTERIQELHFCHLNAHGAEVCNWPMPRLEVLTVKGCDYDDVIWEMKGSPYLFAGHTPRLRSLSLSSLCWLPGNQFTTLKQLFLTRLRMPHCTARVLDFFAQCPNLEDLVIAIRTHLSDIDVSERTVPLAKLRRLAFLETERHVVVNMLSHMIFPNTTAVRIVVDKESGDVFGTISCLPVAQTIRALSIYTRTDWSVCAAVGPHSGFALSPMHLQDSYTTEACLSWFRWCGDLTSRIKEAWLIGDQVHGPVVPILTRLCNLEVLALQPHDLLAGHPLRRSVHSTLELISRPLHFSKLTTLHVLHAPRETEQSVTDTVRQLFMSGIYSKLKLLTIDYLPGYRGERIYKTDFDGYFACVKYRDLDTLPHMAIPEVCKTGANMYWSGFEPELDLYTGEAPYGPVVAGRSGAAKDGKELLHEARQDTHLAYGSTQGSKPA
ncbi:uncharacterized protein LAESUDRAFT_812825 [Laetiporus sulphureus 93-53]|uniref:Uncharacterized protein n=1 Tax=Laetiporus sulphureus 93-53 TaxID=1314785 RepID=A0A165E458_9APHY|nr:uncharacterized protein LAESUDRAFT_812825 [Laetiporus sulphureus 93-53]KZT06211.1 hypothetical protein LAESUDRAFT_812825 [Laetiporus sulphureus 93-53]